MIARLRPLALVLALSPAAAGAEDAIVMTFVNKSSRPANISGVYEMQDDGTSIDDNLGSSSLFPPGATVTVTLGIRTCTRVEVYGWLGDTATEDDAEEVRGETDLCRNRTMILHD